MDFIPTDDGDKRLNVNQDIPLTREVAEGLTTCMRWPLTSFTNWREQSQLVKALYCTRTVQVNDYERATKVVMLALSQEDKDIFREVFCLSDIV